MLTRRMSLMPSLFISHGGGPGFFMKAPASSPFADISMDSEACRVMKAIGANPASYSLPETPKSIVVVSAHWEERDGFHVYSAPKPDLIYDYYGFPPHTYELKYPAPGDVDLANRIVDMINKEPALSKATFDAKRGGFDHGVFLPLMLLYPSAKIPVVQVSLKASMDPVEHYALGKALAPLREEGVLIIGSGQATHPMSEQPTRLETEQFVSLLQKAATDSALSESERASALANLWKRPLIHRTHNPTTEHLMPVVVAAGAARGAPGKDLFKREKDFRFMNGAFSLASFVFGSVEDAKC